MTINTLHRLLAWLRAQCERSLPARLTPQERKALGVVLALFLLGAAVRWLRN